MSLADVDWAPLTKGFPVRSSINRRLALLALIPAMLLGLVAVASPANAAVVSYRTLQADIVRSTNHERARVGCRPVRVDLRLVRAAFDHSVWMSRTGTFSHSGKNGSTFVVRVRRAGYSAPLSENIAWGYRSGADVVEAWMHSPGHRANLLNCRAKSVGVGAFYSADGTAYYTQDFGTV